MKKRMLALLGAMLLTLTACGQPAADQSAAAAPAAPEQQTDSLPQEPAAISPGYEDGVVMRVASLKGPTSMGLSNLMRSENANYTFDMYTAADEIVPLIVKGEVDAALIPANLAATLYQKTKGQIAAVGINTLGVLELLVPAAQPAADLSKPETVLTALEGKTVYMTGKGTTPESALRYLVEKSGMQWDQLDVQFKSEAAEVVAALSADPAACAVLPQPFATVAAQQTDNLRIDASLTELWDALSDDGSQMVTGVTIVRRAFAQEHPAALAQFQLDAADSVAYVNSHPAEAASDIEQLGIVKAGVAKLAIPRCHLVSLTGAEMQTALGGYLNALFDFDPAIVGGAVPPEDFYLV